MQEHSTEQPTTNSLNLNSKTQTDIYFSILFSMAIAMPIILLIGFKTYKKYRAAVLRKQIVSLEKIWQLDVKKKA